MTDLLAARSQMAMSLAFHIVFATIGIAMPLLMILAEALYYRTGDDVYLTLAKKWSKGVGVLFAIGAVSGTVLSFELGLLWPRFMAYAGDIIGMPFSLEGFAFFLEAIFLGIYLYGWDRVPRVAHWLSGLAVMVSGICSGAFVICANGWMNTPAGFVIRDGEPVDIDPIAAMFNPSAFTEGLHMTSAAFESVGFLVAGIHAFMVLRDPSNAFHRRALAIALAVAIPFGLLQPFTGHLSGRHVAHTQPVKFAAMEGHWETESWAPMNIGGWPDEEREQTRYAVEIPALMSIMAHHDPAAEVTGLKAFPREDRPPVAVVHLAFDVMIGVGSVLAVVAGLGASLVGWRRRLPLDRWYLRLLVGCAPLGMVAVEAGWVVTEVGRQPWVIQGVLRTADAVTPMPGLQVPFVMFSLLYLLLGAVVVSLLVHLVRESPYVAEPAEKAA